MDPMDPTNGVLIKLGSIARHVEEATGEGGHLVDVVAIKGLLSDPEVTEWMEEMDSLALLPLKR